MRRLYIDCEWNEFGGDLISMALVGHGVEWYEVFPCKKPGAWVAEHVIPILGKAPIEKAQGQASLQAFLAQVVGSSRAIEIVADWPEDISYFCDFLITGPGKCIKTPPLVFHLCRVDSTSAVPHNALEDARGIMREIEGA